MSMYRLYGLNIESDLELWAPAVASSERADVQMRLGERREVPTVEPPGVLLGQLSFQGQKGYAVSRSESDYHIRFFGNCEIIINPALDRVVFYLAPDADERLASLYATSNVLSVLLVLQGQHVLHASAVCLDGAVFAFCGPSGSGKSTTAAALHRRGATVVTDDALRYRFTDSGVECALGCTELRLRENAVAAASADQTELVTSVDQRLGVRAPWLEPSSRSLSAVICPEFTEDSPLALEALQGQAALIALIASNRISCWNDAKLMQQQFSATASLARRVPVYRLSGSFDRLLTAAGQIELETCLRTLSDRKPAR